MRSLGSLLKESRVPGSDGRLASKLTVRLHRKGAVAKQERSPGSTKTKYYRRSSGQLVYSKLDFLNGAMAIIPPELDGRESTADLPAFDLGSELHPSWLIECLGRPSFYERCAELGRGSRQAPRLGVREFLSLQVALPPFHEQRRIAQVLARFDLALEAARKVLDETRSVQAGVLDALLRGQRQGRSSKELPSSWRVVSLEDLAQEERQCVMTGPYGALLKSSDFEASGVGVLKIGNLKQGSLDLGALDYVSPAKAEALARYRLQRGDLVVARQGATTGKAAMIDERCEGFLFSCHLIRVAVDRRLCLPDFLAVCFRGSSFLSQLELAKIKGTREGVNSKELRGLRLALPPIQEQAQVVAQARLFDSAIAEQEQARERFCQLKAQVCDDLMCGRVRV